MSSSAEVTLINNTSREVTFGIYNAPENKNMSIPVPGNGGQTDQTIGNVDTARLFAAWTSKSELFPNNADPSVAVILFQKSQKWTVTLSNDGEMTVARQ